MATNVSDETRYLTCAETARLVRQALARTFGRDVRFSVTSSVYAGGASIRVRWTGGPTKPEVDRVVRPYAGSNFDGWIDLKWSHVSYLDAEGRVVGVDDPGSAGSGGGYPGRRDVRPPGTTRVHFGADFIFAERD